MVLKISSKSVGTGKSKENAELHAKRSKNIKVEVVSKDMR